MYKSFLSHKAMGTLAIAALVGAGFISSLNPAVAADDAEKAKIQETVKEYLLENPEILLEMQTALEAKQKAATEAKQAETLASMKDKIFNSKFQRAVGNPDGKITVVEFFDYNCGYCRKAQDDMNRLIKDDPDVRFIVKEFPVLGPESLAAHRVSLAFMKLMPEKYTEFHNQLLAKKGVKNEEVAKELALSLGVDGNSLEKEMESKDIDAAIQEAYEIANGLGIQGTPSYVIGDDVQFGAVGYDTLKQGVEAAKKSKEAKK